MEKQLQINASHVDTIVICLQRTLLKLKGLMTWDGYFGSADGVLLTSMKKKVEEKPLLYK